MAIMMRVGKTATSVMCTNGRIAVTYHNTLVVDVTPETITLDSGGWRSVTTKARMNQTSNQFGLGFRVSQQSGKWWVGYTPADGGYVEVPFVDGMTFSRKA